MQNKAKMNLRKQQLQKINHFLQCKNADTLLKQLYQQLFTDPDYLKAETIGITLSMDGEVPTQKVIDFALSNGKKVVVPRTLPHRQMEFVLFDDSTQLAITKFGTREPIGGSVVSKSAIDILVVPGLAFSRNHYRVGFGGGYYDRFLTDFHGLSISIATPPQFFDEPIWPIESFDIKIDKIIH
ncbi:MAG: 5-formyltetrahydrofolate cyclo-ligase [Lentilactobacillus hilgardii]|jgi:5-formyltetrahydrofolate cyclo-ligase|uniref:5-formyltetrahydrofolate cyclo-ligase n=1 Tax=Lentilactobacillus hilgardii TaxID=1588 RepID=A0A6P1EE17_LENHI|nr:5-formyltetrahydrofolate cyclo-ligase [Lentilactobacillus hilgardii]RRG11959.1 MAG: 5-formyltetrahydrofolate cyclo-ligase [Lactobacillus sp.]EEI70218.1 5-formyltetrahydrofolate cyclo-ligase [Lentilactobacillus hilgardii ATCC 27305]MBZ2200815.1 5-formyltetrahydrofolate cyclo-ligase [Lentilactobacillus hilgardii]MBZ2203670.1 5-formyltetrahydrofolate cyclo-ligase [Lentilactobacillus hilgardii]MCT3391680.1 5-formyltetrahydrofolate cyclo-ligase [Lentilactobacillus hilgardii]